MKKIAFKIVFFTKILIFFNSNEKIFISQNEKRKIILLSTRLTHKQSKNVFFIAAAGMERETSYFFTFFETGFRKFFFENRDMADKLAHVKGFRSHPFDFLRHHYYAQN